MESIKSKKMTLDFELLEKGIYNSYEDIRLIFYMKINDKIFILLQKDTENDVYKEIRCKNNSTTRSPLITLARFLTITYLGLFSDNNILKLASKINLEFEDFELLNDTEYIYPELPSKTFHEHIQKLSANIIQYDRIKDKIIYFCELKYFDYNFLNYNIKALKHLLKDKSTYFNSEILNLLKMRFIVIPLQDFSKTEISQNIIKNSDINDLKSEKPIVINSQDDVLIDKELKSLFSFINAENFIPNFHLTPKTKVLFLDLHDENKLLNDKRGYFLYFPLFSGLYRTSDEIWIHQRPYEDDLYEAEDLMNDQSFKSIVIPGSHLHIYHDGHHLKKAVHFLQSINQFLSNNEDCANKNLRILGCCFGHQLLAHSLGGKVDRRAQNNYVHTNEKINFKIENENDYKSLSFLKLLTNSNSEYKKHFNSIIKPEDR